MASRAEWWALASIARVGPKSVHRLLEAFGSLEEALAAEPAAILATGALRPAQLEQLTKRLQRLDEWEESLEVLSMDGIDLIPLDSDAYPSLLRLLRYPPPLLFARGACRDALEAPSVAIVGARGASEEGAAFALALARSLARRGIVVVSGMALGVDMAAHQGALEGGGPTIGVLGSGLLNPRGADPELLEDVCRSGVVLSELQPAAPPTVQNLMARNRIVAGLGRAMVVVEFGATTGSINAATRARELGRTVLLGPLAAAQTPGLAEMAAGAITLTDPHDHGPVLEALARPLSPQAQGLPEDGQPELPM